MTTQSIGGLMPRTRGQSLQWLLPLIPIALAVFFLSALIYYHIAVSGRESTSGLFQALVVALYEGIGFVPAVMMWMMVLAWCSIWFMTGSLERPWSKAGRVLGLVVCLAVLVNLQQSAPFTGELGRVLATPILSLFGYELSSLIVALVSFASLLLATDFFFYRHFEGLGTARTPGKGEEGVENEAADALKELSLGVPVSPAARTPAARTVMPVVPEVAAPEPAAEDDVIVDGSGTVEAAAGTAVVDEEAPEAVEEEEAEGPEDEEYDEEEVFEHGEDDEAPDEDEEETEAEEIDDIGDGEESLGFEEDDEVPDEDEEEIEAEEVDDIGDGEEPLEFEEDDEVPDEEEVETGDVGDDEESLEYDEDPEEEEVGDEEEALGYGDEDASDDDEEPPEYEDEEEGAGTGEEPDDEGLLPFGASTEETTEAVEADEADDPDEAEDPEEAEDAEEAVPTDEPIVELPRPEPAPEPAGAAADDGLVAEAAELVRTSGRASASFLQRRLRIEFEEAVEVLQALQHRGVVEIGDSGFHGRVL